VRSGSSLISKRRVVSGLAAISLAAGVLAFLPGGPAQASGGLSSEVAAVQRSWSYVPEYATAPSIDRGVILTGHGQPVSGATVVVFPAVLAHPLQSRRQLVPAITRTITDAAGRFNLRLPRAMRALLTTPNSGGFLNLHILAFYPGGVAQWFVPISPHSSHGAWGRLVLRQTPQTETPDASSAPDGDCYYIGAVEEPNNPMIVGYKSNTKADINYSTYYYSKTASETNSVAVSVTGDDGSFTESGSTTVDSGFAADVQINGGPGNNNIVVASTWLYGEYTCGGVVPYSDYQAQFDFVSTLSGTPGASAVPAGDCSAQAPNIAVTYSTTTQTAWEYGATLNFINLSVSAQDGWTTQASLTYDLSSDAPICGVHNYPNGNDPSAGYLQTH